MQTARDMLESSGWEIEDSQSRYSYISISASLPAEAALSDMNVAVKSLDRALDQLRF